jgi:peroxin-12
LPPPVVSGIAETVPSKPSGRSGEEKARIVDATAEEDEDEDETEQHLADKAPIAAQSLLPVYTVPTPPRSDLCPICRKEITTPTACQTGIVYCYVCIHKWVTGAHAKQETFMGDKMGKWESGIGRCAVTGRRVLGGTEGLRRIMV